MPADLIFADYKIHEKTQEHNEPFEKIVTNFLVGLQKTA